MKKLQYGIYMLSYLGVRVRKRGMKCKKTKFNAIMVETLFEIGSVFLKNKIVSYKKSKLLLYH